MTDKLSDRVVALTGAGLEKFWAKVEKRGPDECWPWLGAKSSYGYGRFTLGGAQRPATRLAWEIENGSPFPSGKLACHTCDNPSCVNPAHIWPGTQSENLKDCVVKGRHKSVPTTECQRGHSMLTSNRAWTRKGYVCRECSRMKTRERMRRMTERRKAAALKARGL